MIVIVILNFFLSLLLAVAANDQEPAFCENGMELTVVVRTAHNWQPVGICDDWGNGKTDAERLARENACKNKGNTGLKVSVNLGGSVKNTSIIPCWVDSSNGVFRYDTVWTDSADDVRNFEEYYVMEGEVKKKLFYPGTLVWSGEDVKEDDLANVEFSIINNNKNNSGVKPLDVRPFKSLNTVGKAVMLKWNGENNAGYGVTGNDGWVQITADVVVKCSLDPCESRDAIMNDCSSVLDEDSAEGKCYSLTYSLDGVNTVTECSLDCPSQIFEKDEVTGNCKLKMCVERTVHPTLKCGSSDCYPSPTDSNDETCYTSCPPFFTRGAGICKAETCSTRDPISGVCSWDEGNEENKGCGYLRNEILCNLCSDKLYEAIDGVCILKPCTERLILAGSQYACGDGTCLGQPDGVTCDTSCPSINYVPSPLGLCLPKRCCLRTPMVKRSGLPCETDDCFLQPFKDACADDCPTGYQPDTLTGVCVSEECAGRTPSVALAQSIGLSNRSEVMNTRTYSNLDTYSNTHIRPVAYSDSNAGGTHILSTSSASNETIAKTPILSHTHMETPFRDSRTSNAPHTYPGPAFCVEGISVDLKITLVHLDNTVCGTQVGIKIGNQPEQLTDKMENGDCTAVFWDADFLKYFLADPSKRTMGWSSVNQADLEDVIFKIYNDDGDADNDAKYAREDIHVNLNTYKQRRGGTEEWQSVGIELLNKTKYQILVFMDIKVLCSLTPCASRAPADGSCSSSLDGSDWCLTLIEPGTTGCKPISGCYTTHYNPDTTKRLCVLKPCAQRDVDGGSCGSAECKPRPDDPTRCDIEMCPVFYERNPVSNECDLLPCEKRNPHDGNCRATVDDADYPCGYLKDGPKCVLCDSDHLPGYAFDDGVCCAQDHYKDTVDSNKRCDLKLCTDRHLNTSTPYLCGDGNCHYQPETNRCVENCLTGTAFDARGFCGPAPVEDCPTPITTPPADSPFPCREATCYYLQPDGTCKPTCEGDYRHDFMGVCVHNDCTKRTYNPREENWPCGWPEEDCFQDLGPDAEDPLQEEYTKCIFSPRDTDPLTGCTNPFFETNSTEALRTGKCTRMPCEDRRPQVVTATEYTCGDHCVYVPPRVVDNTSPDYDPNDIGRCIDEPPPPPPTKAKAPLTVQDFWWVFLLIALLIIAAISVILFLFLWRIKKHHDAQVENDRDLMMRTAEDREKMKMNKKEGVKEELLENAEGGLIFGDDGQVSKDTWMKDECSDEYVVDAVRCAPPFDIVHCDRRRTLFALYTELSANALASREGDPAAALRRLLPEKLQDPLNPSMAVALVLRHLHQEYTNGVGNITPHSLLVSTKGSLALVVTRDGLANQVDGAFENARWYAPEQKFDSNPTHATDIYSLALVMWQTASALHEVPLAEVDSQSAFTRMAGSYRPSLRDIQGMSVTYDIRAYTQVIEACWVPEGSERPTAAQVVDSLSALTSGGGGGPSDW